MELIKESLHAAISIVNANVTVIVIVLAIVIGSRNVVRDAKDAANSKILFLIYLSIIYIFKYNAILYYDIWSKNN